MARIDQVSDTIYRISVFTPEKRISFNQFLLDDERPALVHTGQYPMYEEVRDAVSRVLDPSRLRTPITINCYDSANRRGLIV